ncbi:ankyrin repeat domain-containing protein [Flavobacterium sp. 3HN19-14]|uniref:ankyrin repeat domain-containing protein n=1 Tax=Flavobacterium sp. 3HN19-14 TaxID=3448133 RepID=UPI003EE16A50
MNIFDIARKGTVEQVKAVFKSNPEIINATNDEGYSPLILACYRSNNEVAKFLIDNGSDIDYLSGMGTALMSAVVKHNDEIANLLISRHANVNLSDPNGMTALIYATMFKNYGIAALLCKKQSQSGGERQPRAIGTRLCHPRRRRQTYRNPQN